MATFPWYRGETYKFSLLLHDKAGAVGMSISRSRQLAMLTSGSVSVMGRRPTC